MVVRAGSDKLFENAKSIGWGIFLILGLAGISHVVKTFAWRLNLPGEINKVSFSRTLGLRLVSEAIGQFGFLGQVVGDATRVSFLTSELPASSIISSVTLDRGLFMLSGLFVTIAGLVAVVFVPTISRRITTLCESVRDRARGLGRAVGVGCSARLASAVGHCTNGRARPMAEGLATAQGVRDSICRGTAA